MASKGFPNVITSSQQYNIGEKLSVILYTYINLHAGTPKSQFFVKRKNIFLHRLQYCNISCALDYKLLLYKGSMTLLFYIIIYILKLYCNVLVLFFVWCPCMEINVNVQYNGGFLSGT